MKKLILFILLCCSSFLAVAQEIKIIDKPIIYDSTRIRLSLEYLKQRHGIEQETPTIQPKIIVLHWTAAKTFSSTFNAFNPSKLPNGDRKDIATVSSLNTSSQYMVDRDGTIYRLMPDNYFARHVIGLNYCAIGVENVGSADFPLTDAQLKANEDLVRYLQKKYKIEYLIGHYEYTKFKGTPLWKETNPNYQTGKTDPGVDFMRRIRTNLKDLALKGIPAQ
ncbi:MAG: peptidoglycan recognition family protein [Pedobacter sp.]|uniref:peptidoglycan recognition protein family protein n=1 Tax=Pedobacter sp. TaxID=1411316 RepID=UPI0028083FDC|nr:peptidoglycan recognition family protein [Pedobacter sp.]MDQ8005234.1 peptidoglycan recognition family protein [Pedobacter sp.]